MSRAIQLKDGQSMPPAVVCASCLKVTSAHVDLRAPQQRAGSRWADAAAERRAHKGRITKVSEWWCAEKTPLQSQT
eukprot:3951865-Pyramimonas_sp.AAC.1